MNAREAALKAQRLLSDGAETFDQMERDLLAEIGGTRPEEMARRESLYHQFNAIRAVRERLGAQAAGALIEDNRDSLSEDGFSR